MKLRLYLKDALRRLMRLQTFSILIYDLILLQTQDRAPNLSVNHGLSLVLFVLTCRQVAHFKVVCL
jgi:hypothetical protein